MPRKEDNQRNTQFSQINTEQSLTPIDMEIEPENNNEQLNENKEQVDNVPNLNGIEEERIEEQRNSFLYIPDVFNKSFIPQDDSSKVIALMALKLLLAKQKNPDRLIKYTGPQFVYIINKQWYVKWKKYSRYETIKRVIKNPEIYSLKPIQFTVKKEDFPGKIINKDLLIRNKINDKERNILVSNYNDCLDTKLEYKKDFKLLAKERFDLLKEFFQCDCIIKAKKIQANESKNYNAFSAHFKIIFLPTLELFKNINEENIESFKKTQNIIYDIYLKQGSTWNEFLIELKYILLENPQILSNMGINLINQNSIEEIKSHLNKFEFYIPNNTNKKNTKEIVDYIFSNETIELIKKNEKIKHSDISKLFLLVNQFK